MLNVKNQYENESINYDTFLLNNTIDNMDLEPDSIKMYKFDTLKFLKINNITLEDLINKIKPLQYDRIENGKIIKYNPNDNTSLIKQYYNNYISYCQINKNKDSSIKVKLQRINRVLKSNDVIIPKITIKIKNTNKKKSILTKDDMRYILNYLCNPHQKAYYTFLASTGIRIGDVVNFTIKDFIKATSEIHKLKTTNINEFLKNIDSNYMVGYWEFIPHKTQKSGLVCKTCNSAESSNYIIESIKSRIESIKKHNRKCNDTLELTEDSPLFGNMRRTYTTKLTPRGITSITSEKNKRYKEYKLKSLENKFMNDEINLNQYEKLKNNLPIFHPHGLRSYFISVLSQYIPNNNIRVIMEAHTSDINTDKYYIGESEELYNETTIREAYNTVEEHLTFNYNFDIFENQLKRNNKELSENYKELEKENRLLHDTLADFKNKYDETREKLKIINDFVDIFELEEGVTDFNNLKRIKL